MHPTSSALHVASASSITSSEGSSSLTPPAATALQERTTQVAVAISPAAAPTSVPAALATKTVTDTSSSSSSASSVTSGASAALPPVAPALRSLDEITTAALLTFTTALPPHLPPGLPSLMLSYCEPELRYSAKNTYLLQRLKTEKEMEKSRTIKSRAEVVQMLREGEAELSSKSSRHQAASQESHHPETELMKQLMLKTLLEGHMKRNLELCREEFLFDIQSWETENLPLEMRIQLQNIEEICVLNPLHRVRSSRDIPLLPIFPELSRTRLYARYELSQSLATPILKRQKEIDEIHSFFQKVVALDLSNRGLTSFPPGVHLFTNLVTLDLRGNPFTSPPDLRGFTHLTSSTL